MICLSFDRLRAFFISIIIFDDQESLTREMKYATSLKISFLGKTGLWSFKKTLLAFDMIIVHYLATHINFQVDTFIFQSFRDIFLAHVFFCTPGSVPLPNKRLCCVTDCVVNVVDMNLVSTIFITKAPIGWLCSLTNIIVGLEPWGNLLMIYHHFKPIPDPGILGFVCGSLYQGWV